jgi:hypothetical protein
MGRRGHIDAKLTPPQILRQSPIKQEIIDLDALDDEDGNMLPAATIEYDWTLDEAEVKMEIKVEEDVEMANIPFDDIEAETVPGDPSLTEEERMWVEEEVRILEEDTKRRLGEIMSGLE